MGEPSFDGNLHSARGWYVVVKDSFTPDSPGSVQVKGSNMELFGATVANRPNANTVPVGATFMSVQTQEVWQSDGVNWKVI